MRIFVFLCLLLAAAGCDRIDDPAEQRANQAAASSGPIKIGLASSFSAVDILLKEGVVLAQEEINRRPGKLLGRELDLVIEDDRGELEEGRRVAHRYAENRDVVAVIGHLFSSISVPVSSIYNYYGILMFSPASTAPKLTSQSYRLVFRNIVTDKEIGIQLAHFVRREIIANKKRQKLLTMKEEEISEEDLNVRVMIFNARDDYGQGLANEFEKEAQTIDVEVIDRRSYDPVGKKVNVKNELRQWQYREFDAIILAGVHPEATAIIRQMRELGITQPVCGGDGLDNAQIIQEGGDHVAGMVAAVPYFFDENSLGETSAAQGLAREREFVRAFKERWEGESPDTWSAQGYDALMLLAAAIDKARSTEPRKIAAALHALNGWQGVTGSHSFDANGDVQGRHEDNKDGKTIDGKDVVFKIVKGDHYEIFSDRTPWEYTKR